jgi:hypothetical protein
MIGNDCSTLIFRPVLLIVLTAFCYIQSHCEITLILYLISSRIFYIYTSYMCVFYFLFTFYFYNCTDSVAVNLANKNKELN